MRNILPFLTIPTVVAPLAVVSCTDKLPDIRNDLETTDLGYVNDLSSTTILQVFLEKNPKVNMASPAYAIYGESRQATIRIFPGNYYKSTRITITYYSKLDFDKNNQKDYKLTKENNQAFISFRILDDLYDENLDPKISWIISDSSFYQSISDFIKFDCQINKAEKNYQVAVSLKDDINEESLQISGELNFHYNLDPQSIYEDNVILARINLKIEI